MDVAFESITTQRLAVVEGRHRVLGRQLRTAAVSEHQSGTGCKRVARWNHA
jgi:hypothetical protein